VWRLVKAYLSLSSEIKWLVLEAVLFLAWARVLKALPFNRIAPSLGVQMQETPGTGDQSDLPVIRRISRVVRRVSPYTIWESKCLVMAIAAMKMLERRGIESTIYLGTAKDEGGRLIAHAWLRSGPLYVTGAELMSNFIVVAKFAKLIRNQSHSTIENNRLSDES
jgi:hypothetical protein